MIIWSGLGFLVVVLVAFAFVVALVLSPYVNTSVFALIWAAFSSLLVFGLHKMLSRKKPQIVIDEESGERIELRANHSLFFIPVKWWPAVLLVLGVLLFLFPMDL